MSQDRIKEAIKKILKDNLDGNLANDAFRDMLTTQLLGILTAPQASKKSGATVMTQSASMFNPKEHGPKGPTPETI